MLLQHRDQREPDDHQPHDEAGSDHHEGPAPLGSLLVLAQLFDDRAPVLVSLRALGHVVSPWSHRRHGRAKSTESV